MKSRPAIALKDWYTLVAVWEFYDKKWRLVKLARLLEAMALCNQPKRLVFPTDINPNAIWKKSQRVRDGENTNRAVSQVYSYSGITSVLG
ncbi:MAG: hypothetical protein JO235_11005 [Chroococcidiopsidaceae cyanobacterium CP_BM_RX_35]|nr:hypothetical protein [Chroococcidiopsidaceae cyanobacterium CP_BM_RX_35]